MKKILSMLLFGLYLIFVFGIRVEALELVEEPIMNVWYFRKGGGKSAFSAQFKYYEIDGKTTYCIEPGEHITTHDYEEADLITSPYSNDINDLIGLIGYYGYDYPGHNTQKYRMATQALIWEVTGGQTVEYWTKPSGAGTFINVQNEKNEIMNLVNNHPKLPSFAGETKDGYINSASIFTDNFNTIDNFNILLSDDYNYLKHKNELQIYPKREGLIKVTLQRKTYTDNYSTLFVGVDSKSQTMGYFGISPNDTFNIYVDSHGGTITLNKVDSNTLLSYPRGDGKLEGAIYGVYDTFDREIDEIVIGSNGVGVSSPLGLGIYIVKEKQAGIGYNIDNTTYKFTISKTNLNLSKMVTEMAISSTIDIYKVLNDQKTGVLTPEENITFEFYLKSSNELYSIITTDENGYATTELPYGKYIVKQINSTPGYEKNDDFEINVDGNYIRKIIADSALTGAKLKVVKKDAETNNIIKKDGIKFKIKNKDTNEYVCQNISYPESKMICEYETKDGMFITPDKLSYGNYELEEIDQVIDGYLWNSDEIFFTIDDNSNYTYDEELGNILELNFYNNEVKGVLELNKIGEKMVLDNNNYYYKDILLDNVLFELYSASDIYSGDGTKVYDKDTLIDKFSTKEGYYKVDNLYLGNYYIKEVNNNEDYVELSTPIYFGINYIDEYTPVVSINLEIKNYLKKGNFELTKVDKDTFDPIKNVLIEIYNKDNDLVYSGLTDEFGKLVLNDLKYGKYYYIEKKASDGYVLDSNKYYFDIDKDNINIEFTNKKEEIVDVMEEPLEKQSTDEIIDVFEEITVPNTYSYEINIMDISGASLLLIGILCQRKRY